MKRLKRASRDDRARLAGELYRASNNTNRIVEERVIDTSFVLARVTEVLEQILDHASKLIDTSRVNLIGFSIGDAVATQVAVSDARSRAVANLDGEMLGN